MSSEQAKPVVVTTTHRGVFFGYLESADADVAVLRNARMALYWSRATRGVTGLATLGPQPGSRVTSAVQRIELRSVTAIMDATEKAASQWESAPWS